MDKHILFLCPHNAAKSVMATAYFNKRARDEGVGARAFSAGTEPDEKVAPQVVALLNREGYDGMVDGTVGGTAHKPRKVSRADVEKADHIVSIGCEPSRLPRTDKNVSQWDDVPMPSQDLDGAWGRIQTRVDELMQQLRV